LTPALAIEVSLLDFTGSVLKTAGAYVKIGGLFPFAIGWQLHQGNIPVVRLGGHVTGQETGWECALREVKEEANLQISLINPEKTYFFPAEIQDADLQEVQWEQINLPGPKPLLMVGYRTDLDLSLSLMYLAETDENPTPSAEVKGILLLDPDSIIRICVSSITLDQYLKQGGKAIFAEKFDQNRTLEPFLQLRILSYLMKAQLL
jgi:hypothetical protein